MKASDLTYIHDPVARFVQSHKFLRSLQESELAAVHVRDEALLKLREEGHSLDYLGKMIGVSRQMVHTLERKAKERNLGRVVARDNHE